MLNQSSISILKDILKKDKTLEYILLGCSGVVSVMLIAVLAFVILRWRKMKNENYIKVAILEVGEAKQIDYSS